MSEQTTIQLPVASQTTVCLHGRLIDDVLATDGTRTGQVRCLECGKVFDDPHLGPK